MARMHLLLFSFLIFFSKGFIVKSNIFYGSLPITLSAVGSAVALLTMGFSGCGGGGDSTVTSVSPTAITSTAIPVALAGDDLFVGVPMRATCANDATGTATIGTDAAPGEGTITVTPACEGTVKLEVTGRGKMRSPTGNVDYDPTVNLPVSNILAGPPAPGMYMTANPVTTLVANAVAPGTTTSAALRAVTPAAIAAAASNAASALQLPASEVTSHLSYLLPGVAKASARLAEVTALAAKTASAPAPGALSLGRQCAEELAKVAYKLGGDLTTSQKAAEALQGVAPTIVNSVDVKAGGRIANLENTIYSQVASNSTTVKPVTTTTVGSVTTTTAFPTPPAPEPVTTTTVGGVTTTTAFPTPPVPGPVTTTTVGGVTTTTAFPTPPVPGPVTTTTVGGVTTTTAFPTPPVPGPVTTTTVGSVTTTTAFPTPPVPGPVTTTTVGSVTTTTAFAAPPTPGVTTTVAGTTTTTAFAAPPTPGVTTTAAATTTTVKPVTTTAVAVTTTTVKPVTTTITAAATTTSTVASTTTTTSNGAFAGVCAVSYGSAIGYMTNVPSAASCTNTVLNIDGGGSLVTVTVAPATLLTGKTSVSFASAAMCDPFGAPPAAGATTLTPCKQ